MAETTSSIRVTEAGTPTVDKDASLGQLVSAATRDMSALIRQEIALAKAEIQRDAVAAGLGAGMFAVAAFLGVLSLIFFSVAAAYGIHALGLGLGWSFLIVAGVDVLLAAVLALVGKKSLTRIKPPTRTIATVKDDIAWAKHPTVNPVKRTD